MRRRGKVHRLDASGGTIKSKGQTFTFRPEDVLPGFELQRGSQVFFEADERRAVRVGPPELAATPAPSQPPDPQPVADGGRTLAQRRPDEGTQPDRGAATRRTPSSIGGATRQRGHPGARREPGPRGPRPAPPEGASDAFVNPYNFVPLHDAPERTAVVTSSDSIAGGNAGGEQGPPAADRDVEPSGREKRSAAPGHLDLAGHTGRFMVEIELLTPASVSPFPDGTSAEGVPRWRPHRDASGRVWFPGSSLKGVIRSVCEVLSSSCLSVFDRDTTPSWRPITPSRPGFLRYDPSGQWVVDPAADVRVKPDADVESGQQGTVGAVERDGRLYEASSGRAWSGTYHITEVPESSTKQWQRLFVPLAPGAPNPKSLRLDQRVVDESDRAHEHQIDADASGETGSPFVPVQGPDGPLGKRGRRIPLAELKETPGKPVPVWYREGESPAVGPVALFRMLYRDGGDQPVSLERVLERSGAAGFLPCRDELLCPACRLFGTTWKDRKTSGLRARVFFETVRSTAPVPETDPVELRPLGAPHPSAQTFYLWDPDSPGDPTAPAYANPRAGIRGRKLYWHHPGRTVDEVRVPPAQRTAIEGRNALDKQLRALELLPAGTRLRASVRYEALTEVELGLLVLALEPGRLARLLGSGGEIAHKIGGGKPLGLGSATLRVVECETIDPAVRYAIVAGDDVYRLQGDELRKELDRLGWTAIEHFGLSLERPDVRCLLHLLDYTALARQRIHYPPGSAGDESDPEYFESFRWFGELANRDRRSSLPAEGKDGRGPDPLRPVSEIEERKRQWGWSAPANRAAPSRGSRPPRGKR